MNIELGAYFYPLNPTCKIRQERALEIGREVVDETDLVKQAQPLFPNHQQPKIYTVGQGITRWDDSDLMVMQLQVELAQEYLDFFIFDTYIGGKGGELVQEMSSPLDNAFLSLQSNSMKFALMLSQNSPRAVLPVSPLKNKQELGRKYDLNSNIAQKVIDQLVRKYWEKANYLLFQGNPYVSVWVADAIRDPLTSQETTEFLYELQHYAHRAYGIDPYLVGVIKCVEDAKPYLGVGINNLTGYAFLADFDNLAMPIQEFTLLLQKRMDDWNTLAQLQTHFIPPAVVGWDSSPRGEQGYLLEEVQGRYPYVPVVVGSSGENFKNMLKESLRYIVKNIPVSEQYGIICAWNEISEGCALLPQVLSEGKKDDQYLSAIRSVRQTFST